MEDAVVITADAAGPVAGGVTGAAAAVVAGPVEAEVVAAAAAVFPGAAAASVVAEQEGAGDMKHHDFLKQLRDEDIVAAICEAEQKTSGEIRVFVSRKDIADPVAAAQKQFERLGMTKTRHRNGVLIFVAPRARKFAVIGDTAIHQRCGDAFWQALTSEMTLHFKKSDFTAGIVHAIRKAGNLLASYFPPQDGDGNELPDAVERD